MFKKISLVVLACMMLLSFCITSYAASVPAVIYDSTAQSKSEFLVTITRPEGDESTFKKSYVICGNTEVKDIRVEIAIQNKDGKYIPFPNTDGEAGWDVGESGIFMKEVQLPDLGANKVRIAAYKKSEVSSLELDKNLQINDYTITVLKESVKETIKNGIVSVTDLVKEFFKPSTNK